MLGKNFDRKAIVALKAYSQLKIKFYTKWPVNERLKCKTILVIFYVRISASAWLLRARIVLFELFAVFDQTIGDMNTFQAMKTFHENINEQPIILTALKWFRTKVRKPLTLFVKIMIQHIL